MQLSRTSGRWWRALPGASAAAASEASRRQGRLDLLDCLAYLRGELLGGLAGRKILLLGQRCARFLHGSIHRSSRHTAFSHLASRNARGLGGLQLVVQLFDVGRHGVECAPGVETSDGFLAGGLRRGCLGLLARVERVAQGQTRVAGFHRLLRLVEQGHRRRVLGRCVLFCAGCASGIDGVLRLLHLFRGGCGACRQEDGQPSAHQTRYGVRGEAHWVEYTRKRPREKRSAVSGQRSGLDSLLSYPRRR